MSTLVSICIATYKRPEGLNRLLLGLNQLTFNAVPVPDIEIIVADNDANGSARPVCEALRSQIRWKLKYDIEPKPGVTYARNRSIANASHHSNFIAIIDDDEVPEPQWLDQLLQVQSQYNADVVSAPVYPYFEDKSTPDWIKQGPFFQPAMRENGQLLHVASTNNVLIRKECLRTFNPVFDNRFALKGMEDSYLFMQLHRNHYKIVWAKEARVVEWIPAARANLRWIVRRNFYGWSSYSWLEKEILAKGQFTRALKGVALIAMGLLTLPFSILKGKESIAKSIINVSRGMGTFSGLIGYQGEWNR
ncbi:glycosyltransferase family 2 protein [Leptolyngbya ohadii]|uniref:glycosyltransferase family 2 protein n=1 Tax=Leptolyngbya ohadii TaxID=1962290 RepID=UPI000B59B7DE|nr:glycosyltransferase [Leptolyngbya ohadii]